MADLRQGGGNGRPRHSLMKKANLDLFHPLSILASDVIKEFGSYRNFLISNKKQKKQYKYGILLFDIENTDMIRILKPRVVYSDVSLTDQGKESIIFVDVCSTTSKKTTIIYGYGDTQNERIHLVKV